MFGDQRRECENTASSGARAAPTRTVLGRRRNGRDCIPVPRSPMRPCRRSCDGEDSREESQLRRMSMGELVRVAAKADIVPGSAIAVEVKGQKIALFNIGETYYAIGETALTGVGHCRKALSKEPP